MKTSRYYITSKAPNSIKHEQMRPEECRTSFSSTLLCPCFRNFQPGLINLTGKLNQMTCQKMSASTQHLFSFFFFFNFSFQQLLFQLNSLLSRDNGQVGKFSIVTNMQQQRPVGDESEQRATCWEDVSTVSPTSQMVFYSLAP